MCSGLDDAQLVRFVFLVFLVLSLVPGESFLDIFFVRTFDYYFPLGLSYGSYSLRVHDSVVVTCV